MELHLPRTWFFPELPGLRDASSGTYGSWPLDEQPPVPDDDSLQWLENAAEARAWSITETDVTPVTPLTPEGLAALVGDSPAPPALAKLAARPDLARRIRSYTGCYLDLGEHVVPTTDGGRLIHFLSDQQFVLHWLAYTNDSGDEAVLCSADPWGFGPDEWADESAGEVPLEAVADLRQARDVFVCADSVAEFFYRYWVENELAFRQGADGDLRLSSYAAQLTARSTAS